jgi:hypothetical protein
MAERDYEEFVANSEFAAAVSAAYRGRHDVRDAVWWLDHPSLSGPTGAVSPADGRDELERAAYSRAGATDPAWADALQRLDAELDADRAATREAIAEARRPVEVVEAVVVVDASSRRRWGVPVIAAVVAVLIGLVIGFQVGSTRETVEEPGYVTATNQATQQFDGIDAFARQEEPNDTPGADLPSSFDGASFRVLSASTGGVLDLPLVYAARIEGNRMCLIAVVGTGDPRATFACVVEEELPLTGLQVGWQQGEDGGLVSWDGTGGVQMSR